MNAPRTLSCLAVLVVLAGCSPTTGAPMPTPATGSPAASPTGSPGSWPSGRPPLQTTPPLPTGSPAQVSPQRWQAIIDHLSGQGVTGSPGLISAEAVTWPDSSLGCPSPGVSYTQALIEGMRVIVSVDGTRYDYRFGTGTDLKLCRQR